MEPQYDSSLKHGPLSPLIRDLRNRYDRLEHELYEMYEERLGSLQEVSAALGTGHPGEKR
ncbi:MAG: hypothetical protein COV76_03450 [Candidatus Omnitrophica bacterium CG11_big_fil_rev_8_21_14_0_20_64_10]|nr:MAG: hypothetical protein COV76_03450 [Candidatus Omnitrophica bacterium CG11_big_fil_rev_8_21_14_0_20_64_10]